MFNFKTLGKGRKRIWILQGETVAMQSRPEFLQGSWSQSFLKDGRDHLAWIHLTDEETSLRGALTCLRSGPLVTKSQREFRKSSPHCAVEAIFFMPWVTLSYEAWSRAPSQKGENERDWAQALSSRGTPWGAPDGSAAAKPWGRKICRGHLGKVAEWNNNTSYSLNEIIITATY